MFDESVVKAVYVASYGVAALNLLWLAFNQKSLVRQAALQRSFDVALLVGLLTIFVLRSILADYFALTNMFESVLAVNFGMLLCRLVLDAHFKVPIFHLGVMAFIVAGFVFSGFLPQDIAVLPPALMSYWRAIHVPVILLSYALMFFASLGGAFLLTLKNEALKKDVLHLTDKAVTLAVPILAVGTALGAVWANEAWGTYWNWDPKENMAVASLFVFGAYLHLRLNTQVKPEKLAWLLIVGFAVLMLTYIGINILGVGLHSYGNFMMK
jgi:ABC-type transport system involved in cytochrome c biogenesis permease subunit